MSATSDRLDAILTQLGTGERVDALRLEVDPELQPLLEVAAVVHALHQAGPSAAAAEQTVRAVRAAAARQRVAVQKEKPTVGRRWMAAGAIALLVLTVSAGSVFAADSALPDSPLYPVRVAHERAEIALTGSAPRRAVRYADFAVRRADQLPNAKRELSDRVLIVTLAEVRDLLRHATQEALSARNARPAVKTAAERVRRDVEELERQPLRSAVAAAAARTIREVEDDEAELDDD